LQGFVVDDEDSSLTRSNQYMLELFEKAGMQVGALVKGSLVVGLWLATRRLSAKWTAQRLAEPELGQIPLPSERPANCVLQHGWPSCAG
jgi:hypothetical protein